MISWSMWKTHERNELRQFKKENFWQQLKYETIVDALVAVPLRDSTVYLYSATDNWRYRRNIHGSEWINAVKFRFVLHTATPWIQYRMLHLHLPHGIDIYGWCYLVNVFVMSKMKATSKMSSILDHFSQILLEEAMQLDFDCSLVKWCYRYMPLVDVNVEQLHHLEITL